MAPGSSVGLALVSHVVLRFYRIPGIALPCFIGFPHFGFGPSCRARAMGSALDISSPCVSVRARAFMFWFFLGLPFIILVTHIPGIACPRLDSPRIANEMIPAVMLFLLWRSGKCGFSSSSRIPQNPIGAIDGRALAANHSRLGIPYVSSLVGNP